MTIKPANEISLQRACDLIGSGELVAFPTETVYGLGADADNDQAVAKIFDAKGRPAFNPLIVHVPDIEAAGAFACINDQARKLAEAFWPGPLTIVLPLKDGSMISNLATAGLETVAVRSPDHPVAQSLLKNCGCPIVAPSANRSGHVSPTEASHVLEDLNDRVSLILDGGATKIGIESTVIELEPDTRILRPGAIDQNAIESVVGQLTAATINGNENKVNAPGQLASHYAPQSTIRLNATSVKPNEALLAFGPKTLPHDGPLLNLSESADLIEAAANLFSALRTLDKAGCSAIAVMPIPEDGMGAAINDRLNRAAAPRAPATHPDLS